MGPLNTMLFSDCKIAVVQRQVSEHNRMAMIHIKEAGLKIVYDLDDNIWNLPAYNPGKKVFDVHQDGFLQCAKLADILTVSTVGLATAARTGFKIFDKEIVVVPNSINTDLLSKKDIKAYDDQVIIGWGGSNTHSLDTQAAFESMISVLDNNPKAKMQIVGAPAVDTYTETREINGKTQQRRITKASKIALHKQTDFRPWVPIGEYCNRLSSWGWNIALAPLEDSRFNRSKSNIKCLEAAAVKIPCLCSDVQPYNEFCSLGGPDLKWLLCRTQHDWVTKLSTLINDEAMRQEIGNKMYDVMQRFFNISTIKENWKMVFEKALSC
jgi:glycosyltransferase involved in cell wall biosynthesis